MSEPRRGLHDAIANARAAMKRFDARNRLMLANLTRNYRQRRVQARRAS
jgi:hypothetical protein